MIAAILIGFEYNIDQLTGTFIDLFRAYQWSSSFIDWRNIYLLTDITEVTVEHQLLTAVNKGIVSQLILKFYAKIKNEIRIIQSQSELILVLSEILKKSFSKLVIYYSGHGVRKNENSYLLLPNGQLFPFSDFLTDILRYVDTYTEIFMILDCCNPHGLLLPYKFNGETFRLKVNNCKFYTQPILLITSAEEEEKSLSTVHGSIFTQYLFQLLTLLQQPIVIEEGFDPQTLIPTENNRHLNRLLRNLRIMINKVKLETGYQQTVSIYSSYITDPILWSWIGNKDNYEAVSDFSFKALILRKIR